VGEATNACGAGCGESVPVPGFPVEVEPFLWVEVGDGRMDDEEVVCSGIARHTGKMWNL
jgi:hypothetical protein